jgi:hypothetical protein
MKKALIILGIVAAAGFLLLILFLAFVVYAIHKAEPYVGPALYSAVGASARIDEFAHEQGKTNYIAVADSQLALVQQELNQWRATASPAEISKCEKSQAEAYATMDKNIKNGLNPLAYLDMTNFPPKATATR